MLHAQGQHCASQRSFMRYTQLYVNPAIRSLYFSTKQTIFLALHDRDLVLLGNMQYMSMGHTSTYGAYSLMDYTTGYIISTDLLNWWETRSNSPTLELYGFLHALYHVVSTGLTVLRVVTNEHTQIKKFFSK